MCPALGRPVDEPFQVLLHRFQEPDDRGTAPLLSCLVERASPPAGEGCEPHLDGQGQGMSHGFPAHTGSA